jgi:hypothetical protein
MLYSATTLKMGGGLWKRVNIDDNSTNINTTYNYLSPQNIENKIILRLEIQVLAKDRPKNVANPYSYNEEISLLDSRNTSPSTTIIIYVSSLLC